MSRPLASLVFVPVPLVALSLGGCGCSDTSTDGGPDAASDGEDVDEDPWIPDGPCTGCDDGDPCTLDLCNVETGQCGILPLDRDGDGHISVIGTDGVTFCGGDDCDDLRADTYAGAEEVCADGVDQDCDGIVDGPKVMGSEVRITDDRWVSLVGDVVWTGEGFAIGWAEEWSSVHLAILGPGGEVVDVLDLDRPMSGWRSGAPGLAWSGDRLGVCWPGLSGIVLSQLDLTGDELSWTELDAGERCKVEWTGSEFGVAAVDHDDVWLAGVDGSGGTVRPIVHVPVEGRPETYSYPGIAWTGSQYALTWSEDIGDTLDVWYIAVTPGASDPTEPVRITDYNPMLFPAIAWTGAEIHMVLELPVPRVFFTRVLAGGEVVGEFTPLTPDGFDSGEPDIVWTGSETAVTWIGGTSNESSPVLSLVGADGSPSSDMITLSEQRCCLDGPRVTWTGSEFGVAWSDTRYEEEEIRCWYLMEPDDAANWEVHFVRVGLCE